MRLHILSDLHLEFEDWSIPHVDADLVVLAGDIHIKLNGIRWIKEKMPDRRVLYICGNHEFYGDKFPRLIDKIRQEAAKSSVYFLENEGVEIDGFFFYGGTLWTDMALHGDIKDGIQEAERRMNDYRRVRNSADRYRLLRAGDTVNQHRKFLVGLKQFSREIDTSRLIVVSHHAPSIRSLPPELQSEMVSCAYASRLDDLVEAIAPRMWIHGHIHNSSDYTIGNTRILANPRAYPDWINEGFIDDLEVDISD